jgi:serine/threonine protein phosphatase PrpC
VRLSGSAGRTDAGRRRRRNEDAYVVAPPLFAVADGMGGAQAGEVAARLATAAFHEYHEADELEAEQRVAAIIKEANRRIYERARGDTEVSGMGTTVTAALVEGGRIVIGHVGDSRAYRLRGGRLEQLTDDHSLVADLVRGGRISPEEAEIHPQRSVITRALGTDPEVDVDSQAVDAEAGDVYLLCSDGLTTMVADDEILDIVGRAKSLEHAGKDLVKAANRRGGEDNITVVLFAVEADEPLEETAVMSGDGRGSSEDLEDTLTGLEAPTLQGAPVAAQPAEEERGWTLAPEPQPVEAGRAPREPKRAAARPKRRWRRRLLLSLALLAFVAVLVALAFLGLSRAHFVGADEDGRVAVYQGLPWTLGAGLDLYRARYVSQLRAVQLTQGERAELFDHNLVSYDTARAEVGRYEQEGVP